MSFTQISGNYYEACCCSYNGETACLFRNFNTFLSIIYTTDYFVTTLSTTLSLPADKQGGGSFRFCLANQDCSTIIVGKNGANTVRNAIIINFDGTNFTLSANDIPADTYITGDMSADAKVIALYPQSETYIIVSSDYGATWNNINISGSAFIDYKPIGFCNGEDFYFVSFKDLYLCTASNAYLPLYICDLSNFFDPDHYGYSISCTLESIQYTPPIPIIYIGTDKSALFKSTNYGSTFTQVTTLNRGNIVHTDMSGTYILMTHTYSADLGQYSEDGGSTFIPIEDLNGGLACCSRYETEVAGFPLNNLTVLSGENMYYKLLPTCYCKNTLVKVSNNSFEKIQNLKENDKIYTENEIQTISKITSEKLSINSKNIVVVMRKDKISQNSPSEDLFITSSHYLYFDTEEEIEKYKNNKYDTTKYAKKSFNKFQLLAEHCNLFECLNEKDIEYLNEDGFITLYNIKLCPTQKIINVNNILVDSL